MKQHRGANPDRESIDRCDHRLFHPDECIQEAKGRCIRILRGEVQEVLKVVPCRESVSCPREQDHTDRLTD